MKQHILLQEMGFAGAHPIQEQYWKKAGNYTQLYAPTGSGKTFAFLLQAEVLGRFPCLIISPTRELALQLYQNAKKVWPTRAIAACYGGHAIAHEVNQLQNNPAVVIGTPGRLNDLVGRGVLNINDYQHLIIDEYDKLLELGFQDAVEQLVAPNKWKAIQLSSATPIPSESGSLADYKWEIMSLLNEQKPDIKTYQLTVDDTEKTEQLIDFIAQHPYHRMLVFCAHRDACDRLYEHLAAIDSSVCIYHGGLKQTERERNYIRFLRQSANIMVCTDLAARGLDLPQVEAVIHYQKPIDEATLTHRNGRTGRNGNKGNVIYVETSESQKHPEVKTLPSPKVKLKPLITLYCNAGRKQKLRKTDFIGYLCKELEIPGTAIHGIDIFDQHSYITLEKSEFNRHRQSLSKARIKKERVLIRPSY